jgi:hypothetical protein
MSDDTTGASRSTAAGTARGEYTTIVPVVASAASETTRATVQRETVTASRTDGEISVRLVPSAPPAMASDDTT